jgi:hypothetical protein
MPSRKRPVKTAPEPPQEDVRRKQDERHTEADFLRDLDRVATNRADELLDRAARRDSESPRK